MPTPFNQLSERQQNILQFMYRYTEENHYPPTIREIGEATDINSTSVVNYNLNRLVDAEYIARDEKVARGLRLIATVPGTNGHKGHKGTKSNDAKAVRLEKKGSRVPLIGHIVASQPVEIPEDVGHHYDEDDTLDVTPAMLGGADPDEVFALRVKGDSMIDAMISDNDIVILRHQVTANNGDMVAVWLPERGETTLKYFHLEGDKIRLQPAHPTMDAIYVNAADCEVRGKVLSVIRRLH